MFIAGIFSLFFRSTLLCLGIGAANGVSRGDTHAAVILLLVVALWNWRRILDYIAERRWRY
jgi:hypothetical protein